MHLYPKVFLNLIAGNKDLLQKFLEVPLNKISYSQFLKWFLIDFPRLAIKSVKKKLK